MKLHCPGISNHTYLKKLNWFVTLKAMICYLYIYLQPKNQLHNALSFRDIWVLRNWLVRRILADLSRTIMIIILTQKSLNQWTEYLAKTTKTLIWGYFWSRKIELFWEKVFTDLYQPTDILIDMNLIIHIYRYRERVRWRFKRIKILLIWREENVSLVYQYIYMTLI